MNLTCSPEPYSAVRNANVDLVNYKRGKLFKYWKERGEKNSAGSPCSRVGAFCVMKFVSVLCSRLISLHLKAYMLHYERWLMQSQLRLVLVGALNSSLPLSLSRLLMATASRWCQKETSQVKGGVTNTIYISVHVGAATPSSPRLPPTPRF